MCLCFGCGSCRWLTCWRSSFISDRAAFFSPSPLRSRRWPSSARSFLSEVDGRPKLYETQASGFFAARGIHRSEQRLTQLLQVVRQLVGRIVVPLDREDADFLFVCAAVKFELVSKSVCRRDVYTGFVPPIWIELRHRVTDWF